VKMAEKAGRKSLIAVGAEKRDKKGGSKLVTSSGATA